MKKHFKTYLIFGSILLTTASFQPVYAGESGAGLGAIIGAIIGAIFGDAVEESSKPPSPEKSSSHCVYVNKEAVKSAVESKIDNLCQTHRQSYEDQEKIHALRSSVAESIYHKIDTTCYASQTQAQQDCDNHTKDKVAQYISGLAQEYAQQEGTRWRSRPPVNPMYVNNIDPLEFAHAVGQQVANEVQQQYACNYHGSLQNYWGSPLKNKIAALAQQHYQRSLPKPEPKKEIYEIYPHEKSARRQETLQNISKGKHYRDTECCVCSESFKDIGKRVNLPCGHDICPTCLHTNKYQYNRHECPKCRRHIYNDDFPREYLASHSDS